MRRFLHPVQLAFTNSVIILSLAILLVRSDVLPADNLEKIRAFTRWTEFDYIEWMLDALMLKNAQTGLDAVGYLSITDQREVVYRYLDLVNEIDRLTYEISVVYADPNQENPENATLEKRQELREARREEARLGPLAESVIQAQTSYLLEGFQLATAGQPLPPVLYHVTPLPYALIVSPREKIDQEANISLLPGLSLEERVELENSVEGKLDKSALVVAIGGVGVYPTMVQSTTNINWLAEVVSHEWTHNYLTLRPLGVNYDTTPELRTINETTASIVGKEVGQAMINRFYPEKAPPPVPPEEAPPPIETDELDGPDSPAEPPEPQRFDFRKEMRITRLRVDELLAQGKIDEAEAYMEDRRKVFWDNGYLIRKLNQAYFAFHGAYNDAPGGGAAGEDPVGPAVQALRAQSASLADFLNTIAGVTSFEELKGLINQQ